MEITSVNPDNNYSQHTVSESNWGQMGKSEFLKLITAQLKYQTWPLLTILSFCLKLPSLIYWNR